MTEQILYYTVNICGVERRFPLLQVAPGVKIAIFNMLGDTEVVKAAAAELARRLPKEAEVIVTPAEQGIPYVVVRKERKPYMLNCISAEVVSITTGKPQTLWLDGKDRALIEEHKVVIVDDVISTGSTLRGLRDLMAKAGGEIIAEAAVFTEGDPEQWKDVIALGNLPIFTE